MSKSNNENIQYSNLKMRMQSKADLLNVNWARYYADKLNLGGNHSDQYLRNFFLKDELRFNNEQLAIIYNDLEDMSFITPLTQIELQTEMLSFMSKLGTLSDELKKTLDTNDEISKEEAIKLIPFTRELFSQSRITHFRLMETKHYNS